MRIEKNFPLNEKKNEEKPHGSAVRYAFIFLVASLFSCALSNEFCGEKSCKWSNFPTLIDCLSLRANEWKKPAENS